MDATQLIAIAESLFETATTPEINRACTRAVCRLVEERYGPATIVLQTTDQTLGRGFYIAGVELDNGTVLDTDIVEALQDEAFTAVTSIDWSYLPTDHGGEVRISTDNWPAT